MESNAKKTSQGSGLDPVSDLCLEFARLEINEPFLQFGYGKMPSRRGYILDKELKEESVEVLLDRMPHNYEIN